ncbi:MULTISPECIES: ABC transporter substrate-binding protein [unclassified Pseudomonas]|uniref:substrate-binding periplasmic protein n=1 Tax=unclassified Pseudomonas TaxID=196821 RepID=UPI001EDDA10A|nr:transporter substrate-binding domain-containing protein [Pseudomonas sp. MMS21 TM103]MCG4454049.1 transporter substrate-binding domain-containing protein [Pseudomonas sp. MMS21 TM103]
MPTTLATRLLAAALAVALYCAQLAVAQAAAVTGQPPIRVGYIEFAPYSYTDEHGQPAGHLLEFMQQVAQQAGYQTQFTQYPSYRLFKSMENGQVEMCPSLIHHPLMSSYTLRSRYLVARLMLNLYYKDRLPPAQLEDLRDARVLRIQGLSYLGSPLAALARQPAHGIVMVTAPTHMAAVQMMALRRADYLLDYLDPAEVAFSKSKLPLLPSVTLLQQDFTIAYAMASPRARQLRDDLDRAIDQLQAKGALPEQYAKIFPYDIQAASPAPLR